MRVSDLVSPRGRAAVLSAAVAAVLGVGSIVHAAAFTGGDLVVLRAGDGSATTLTGNAAPVFLDEFTTTGLAQTALNTVALPTTGSGPNRAFTISGSASSEGFLSLSTDGRYLLAGGYDAAPATTGIAATTPTANNRVVARVDLSGAINTTTALTDAFNGSDIRSAASTDGTNIWVAGNAGSGLGASAAVRYTTLGSTTSTQLNATTTNLRVVKIFNNQLYVSGSTGTFLGIGTDGTGVQTTSGQSISELPGFPTSGTHSSYDFWFKDANTVYVADDGTAATNGGIQKWTQSAGTWSLQYTLLNNGTATTDVRNLVGTVDGSGNTILFATTSATSKNTVISITDTGATALATILATAPTNEGFRGIQFIPAAVVPEPGSLGLLAAGGLLALRRRRA